MQIAEALKAYRAQNKSAWEASGAWKNRTLADEVLRRAEASPDRSVYSFDDGDELSYGALMQEALALAAAFQQMGLAKGDVVSFQLPNWREVASLDVACAYLGLVLCPIIPIYRAKEVQFILRASRAKLHLAADAYRGFDYRTMLDGMISQLPELKAVVYVRPEQPCANTFGNMIDQGKGRAPVRPAVDASAFKLILYTSGTTGVPKGVLHDHNSIRCILDTSIRHWNLGPDDVMLMPSPVTHITGIGSGVELPVCCGGKTAFMEKWNAEAAVAYIKRVGATVSVAATPFLVELVDAAKRLGEGLPSMRLFACGGAAVPPEVIRSVSETLSRCRAFRVYGSTETPMITQGFVGAGDLELAANSDGQIVGFEVKVVDDKGLQVAAGQEGEILARGPGMLLGYMDQAHNTDAFDPSGYFRTGDLGRLVPDSGIVITGRKKDLIIRGGENISAKEIEDVLHRHPAVREVSVVAMPHARLGEGVCAYVIPADADHPPTLEALLAVCADARVAKQKWPERIEIVSSFPRTATGKIQKNELRKMIYQKLASDAPGQEQ